MGYSIRVPYFWKLPYRALSYSRRRARFRTLFRKWVLSSPHPLAAWHEVPRFCAWARNEGSVPERDWHDAMEAWQRRRPYQLPTLLSAIKSQSSKLSTVVVKRQLHQYSLVRACRARLTAQHSVPHPKIASYTSLG